jgi:hypothetical protein
MTFMLPARIPFTWSLTSATFWLSAPPQVAV